MELKTIAKKQNGIHLNYYNATYKNRVGKRKIYEFVSRDSDIKNGEDMNKRDSQAVVLAVFDESFNHILLNKEFRMAVNQTIYNVPAGLIDPGETEIEAAKRELKEETGLDLTNIITVLPPSYSAVGISNEKTTTIICTAKGVLGGHPEPNEEIECNWYSKEDIKDILKNDNIASRTQLLCYMWLYH